MLLLEPLLPSLVTTAVSSTATVTSGKLAPAVNSGAILLKDPVAVTVLVSPAFVVNVNEKVYTSFVELSSLKTNWLFDVCNLYPVPEVIKLNSEFF